MSSHRRRRQERSRGREWTPDHYWPADRGWPDDADGPADDDQWQDDQRQDDQRQDVRHDGRDYDEREAQTSPLRRLRPERPHPPKGREWTPDHHWPEDQGWPDRHGRRRENDDERRHDGPMSAVITFVVAALFVAGLGGYGIIRQHHAAVTALRQAATLPCAHLTGAAATRCRSSAPGITDGSGRPAPVASGSATPPGAPAPASGPATAPRPAPSTPATATATPPPATAPAPAPSPVTSTTAPPGTASTAAAQVLALINQARAQAGLPALATSSGLDTSALGHTMVMAAGCGLSHQCPGEPALGARETAAGVAWTSAGENIGEGGPEPNTTSDIAAMAVGLTQAMLNEKPPDDGHRLNILSTSFHHIGIYVLRDASGTVWMTQDFSN
ncbi:MAG TPA: CAP domain-containing protein [Streptosporangiaceae bacterium]|jgi:uncharacterized protein YkwD